VFQERFDKFKDQATPNPVPVILTFYVAKLLSYWRNI